MKQITGGCLCGAVRFTAQGAAVSVSVLDCRKHHGAAFFAAAIFPEGAVEVTGKLSAYEGRAFCPTCGSSVLARSDGEVELHLGALDDPGQFTPEYELWTIRREPWLAPLPGARQYPCNKDP